MGWKDQERPISKHKGIQNARRVFRQFSQIPCRSRVCNGRQLLRRSPCSLRASWVPRVGCGRRSTSSESGYHPEASPRRSRLDAACFPQTLAPTAPDANDRAQVPKQTGKHRPREFDPAWAKHVQSGQRTILFCMLSRTGEQMSDASASSQGDYRRWTPGFRRYGRSEYGRAAFRRCASLGWLRNR